MLPVVGTGVRALLFLSRESNKLTSAENSVQRRRLPNPRSSDNPAGVPRLLQGCRYKLPLAPNNCVFDVTPRSKERRHSPVSLRRWIIVYQTCATHTAVTHFKVFRSCRLGAGIHTKSCGCTGEVHSVDGRKDCTVCSVFINVPVNTVI